MRRTRITYRRSTDGRYAVYVDGDHVGFVARYHGGPRHGLRWRAYTTDGNGIRRSIRKSRESAAFILTRETR